MHSVCCCSLPTLKKKFFEEGDPVDYFCPALDPPLGGSGRKITTPERDLEYFIHTKFHQNLSSGSGEEIENVNCLTDGRTDGIRQTTDTGQRVITIGHWSPILCPKEKIKICRYINGRYYCLNRDIVGDNAFYPVLELICYCFISTILRDY